MTQPVSQLGCLLAISLTAAACNRTPAGRFTPPKVPTGQTIRVAVFPDYLKPAVLESFQSKTGNKVVIETYRTNEELGERLAKGAHYDVVFPPSYAVEKFLAGGIWQPMVH